MSHAPERKEKDCLNCGTVIHGRFCHICGQENVVPKESFWKLVTHFFYDITHFDSKFFETVKDLFFKPGFLSKEYSRGRRASYLNPIRMYVFTSAIFFIIFFAMQDSGNFIKMSNNDPYTKAQRDSLIHDLQPKLNTDSATSNMRTRFLLLSDTTRPIRPSDLLPFEDDVYVIMSTLGGKYGSIKEYDSIQKAKSAGERDGFWKRLWNKRAIRLNEKYRDDPSSSLKSVSSALLHNLPYMLFVSLPFFALILKLLYVRRKNFYYADHGIFTVHHYILSFILLLLVFLLNELQDWTDWGIWGFFMAVTIIAWPVYLFLGMKRFYAQGIIKTFFKFLLLNLCGLIVMALLFGIFFLFSVFQI